MLGLIDMTADPLFLILARCEPLDVLRVCQLSKHFQSMCQNPILFRALLRLHYPNNFETNNPKAQYKAITMGLETTYLLPYNHRTGINSPVQHGRTELPHHIDSFTVMATQEADRQRILGPGYVPRCLQRRVTDEQKAEYIKYGNYHITDDREETDKLFAAGKLSKSMINAGKLYVYRPLGDVRMIVVPGYPIPAGTTAWLLMASDFYTPLDHALVFKSKEALADYVLAKKYWKTFDRLIYSFFEVDEPSALNFGYNDVSVENFDRLMASAEFIKYLQERGPYPFTPDNFYNYVLQHDKMDLGLDEPACSSELILFETWIFRQVTF